MAVKKKNVICLSLTLPLAAALLKGITLDPLLESFKSPLDNLYGRVLPFSSVTYTFVF
jgi:hypothetical protein